MVVGDDYIYIHMPVTGGTFITTVLQTLYDGEIDEDPGAMQGGVRHNTFGSFYNTDSYDKVPEDVCLLGSVRNPYQYYLSVWGAMCEDYQYNRGSYTLSFLDAYPHKAHLINDIGHYASFRKWAKQLLTGGFSKFHHLHFNNSYIVGHDIGIFQYNFIILYCQNRFISQDFKSESIIDEFIRTERILKDLKSIFHYQDIDPTEYNFPKENSREYKGDYCDYYDKELREMVYNKEENIIEEFGYSF